jgi:hypothetical protein
MTTNPGPSYHEWLDILAHSKHASFSELQKLSRRIENSKDFAHLTPGQRADLLRRLGDLQVAAANRRPFISA